MCFKFRVDHTTPPLVGFGEVGGSPPTPTTPSSGRNTLASDDFALTPRERAVGDMDLGDLSFDEAVLSGRLKMPCSTTTAADENGRPAQRGERENAGRRSPKVVVRRPPICSIALYHREAMMMDQAGRMCVPPA